MTAPKKTPPRPRKLSAVESRWRDAANACLPFPIFNDPEIIQSTMRKTAYHEAAHVAARMFTGQEASHFVSVSIIPARESMGRETSERNGEVTLQYLPDPIQRTQGYERLLGLLAGRAAEVRAGFAEEDILEMDSEEWEEPGTDLCRSLNIARIIMRPHFSEWRILSLAEKWTVEMLAIPDVWATVETLATMLLERGHLDCFDEIYTTCEKILDASFHLPKWRRRLLPSNAAMKPFMPQAEPPLS